MIDSLQKKLAFTDGKIESKAAELKKLIESTIKNDNEKLLAALNVRIPIPALLRIVLIG